VSKNSVRCCGPQHDGVIHIVTRHAPPSGTDFDGGRRELVEGNEMPLPLKLVPLHGEICIVSPYFEAQNLAVFILHLEI
jgi:hypothetical protein